MMSTSTILVVLCLCCALSRCQAIQELRDEPTNRIAGPGEPQYYLMADAGSSVGPNDALKRTNRSLLKWWDDLFGQNNCCNNNNNNNNNNYNNVLYPTVAPVVQPQTNCNGYGLQLQDLDPFKQMKLFKKMPDLFGNPIGNCGGLCGGNCGQQPLQPQINYVAPAPPAPGYGGDDGYAKPNPDYNGPGDGDAGYVAPVVPPPVTYDAPVAPPASYEAPAPSYEAPAPTYEAPAPSYEAPAPSAPVYDAPAPPAPSYEQPAATPDTYGKVADYSPPASTYPAAQPPQIVYQPIIYVSAPPASRTEVATKVQVDEQSYNNQPAAPVYEAPTPPAAPVYEAPLEPTYAPPPPPPPAATPCGSYLPLWGVPVYNYGAAQPAAPPAAPPVAPPAYAPAPPPSPGYATPSCATPIRLSLIDQPYRVAPELFEEYHYRLGLAAQNRL